MGSLHGEHGNLKNAKEVCEVSTRGRHLDATCNLSSLHAERGNLKEAMELYDVASRGSSNKTWFSYEFRSEVDPGTDSWTNLGFGERPQKCLHRMQQRQ